MNYKNSSNKLYTWQRINPHAASLIFEISPSGLGGLDKTDCLILGMGRLLRDGR
jgi:hypothetical protein